MGTPFSPRCPTAKTPCMYNFSRPAQIEVEVGCVGSVQRAFLGQFCFPVLVFCFQLDFCNLVFARALLDGSENPIKNGFFSPPSRPVRRGEFPFCLVVADPIGASSHFRPMLTRDRLR